MLRRFIHEFKQFTLRGNVLELAIGVIIGAAFQKIVSSLVADIITPVIGIILGGLDFKELAFNIGESSIKYGLFIQNVIDFVIVAFVIFVSIKALNRLSNGDLVDLEATKK